MAKVISLHRDYGSQVMLTKAKPGQSMQEAKRAKRSSVCTMEAYCTAWQAAHYLYTELIIHTISNDNNVAATRNKLTQGCSQLMPVGEGFF